MMSHIHDALRKAQEEKDSLYQRYKKLISSKHYQKNGKRVKRKILKVTAVMLFVLTLTAFIFHFNLSDTNHQNVVTHRSAEPEKVIKSFRGTKGESKIFSKQPHDVQKRVSSSQEIPTKSKIPMRTHSTQEVTAHSTRTTKAMNKLAKAFDTLEGSASPDTAAGKSKEIPTTADVKLLYREALLYQQKDDLTKAQNTYRKILRIDPKNISALNNLGVIYMSQKRSEAAKRIFTKAINLNNDYVEPYYNLACLYSRSGDTSNSLNYLKKAIKLKNDVKNWAINDTDLVNIRALDEFKKIVGQTSKVTEKRIDTYIVKKDDWIFDIIRRKCGTSDKEILRSLKLIKRLNPELKNTNIIYPGQKLLLPKREVPEKKPPLKINS
ncbi:MAG: tetratricopeptide repeat protein [Deltaproteobacteria bacterium]|nr:tetratricopeptide repeat protein [Deltaproteobacteria bacterium]